MPLYLVNKEKRDGKYHEVHLTTCTRKPLPHNSHQLGNHTTCSSALAAAEKDGYKPADGCKYCSPACHKG